MDESVQQFVERMGLICEKEGMARSAGRIFGLLLIGGRPYSLDELAEKLQASKAGVSTNCRLLEQFGMIERVSSLGDRRDFYRVQDSPWEHIMRVAQTRWREMVKIFGDAQAALPPQMAVPVEINVEVRWPTLRSLPTKNPRRRVPNIVTIVKRIPSRPAL